MRRIWTLGLAALAALACSKGGDAGPKKPAVLTAIAVSPPSATTIPGAAVAFTATGTYDDGSRKEVTAEAAWTSSDSAVATLDGATIPGVATGRADGTATIGAAIGALRGTATLKVETAVITSLRLDPTTASVPVGGSAMLRCLGRAESGAEYDLTSAVTWSSAAPLLATVQRGAVTGVAVGETDVRADYAGLSAQAHVTVTPATLASLALGVPSHLTLPVGASVAARAFARYSDGSQQDVTALATWTSGSPGVVAVSDLAASRGALQAKAMGGARVTAAWQGRSASADVSVVADAPLFVLVEPVPSPLRAGVAIPLRATALHADGTVADVTAQAAWASDAGAVTVDASGVATTVSSGVAVVTATYAGLTGRTVFSVIGATPTGLAFGSASYSVGLGDYVWRPTVTLRYDDGTSYDVTDVVALVPVDPEIAALDRTGLGDQIVRGIRVGSTTLEARYAGLVASAPFTVAAPLSFTIDAPASVPAGAAWQVHASTMVRGTYASYPEDVTAWADWTSSAPAVIAISSDAGSRGFARVVGAGSATLTATFAGYTASRTVTVVGAVQSISVEPASVTVSMRQGSARMTAMALVSGGQRIDVSTLATWTANPQVGYWSDGDFNAAGLPGTTLVTAAVGSIVGTGTATAVDEPDGLGIRPELQYGVVLPVGHTASFQAVYLHNYGWPPIEEPVSGAVTWTTDTPAVAAFDDPAAAGKLHALSAGSTYVRAATKSLLGTPLAASMTITTKELTGYSFAPVTVSLGGATSLMVLGQTATASYAVPFFTFESSDPSVASVSGTNVVGRKLGTAQLTARLDDLSVTTTVTVGLPVMSELLVAPQGAMDVGTSQPAGAWLLYDNWDLVDVSALATWSTSDASVVALSGTPPQAAAVAPGGATLTADWGGLSGSSAITVTDPGAPAATDAVALRIEGNRIDLPVGGSTSFRVLRLDAYGGSSEVAGAIVTSSAPDVVSVTTSRTSAWGSVLGHKLGSAVLTATYGGKTAVAVVNVSHEAGRLYVRPMWPLDLPLHAYQRTDFWAQELGGSYATVASGLAWASSDPAVVTVDAYGTVTGVAPGTAYVTAASSRSVESYPVRVLATPVVALVVAGAAPVIPAGGAYTFQAAVRFADGVAAEVSDRVEWSSADPTIADFDPLVRGRLVTKKAGMVRVEARLDGRVGAADVMVF